LPLLLFFRQLLPPVDFQGFGGFGRIFSQSLTPISGIYGLTGDTHFYSIGPSHFQE